MNQNLELSLCAAYLSLSDQDADLKPKVKYKWTDNITEDNTNAYTTIRFSF
nr:hypothetical protein [uncultured Desulfobacter sp.]